jgi:hypothetical protein
MDWPGLLKWSMKNTDSGNLKESEFKPMSEEDVKWLSDALENFQFNEMKEIMKILDKLKVPELETQEDEEERCLLLEDLIILIDGLENNRSKNLKYFLNSFIKYFIDILYYIKSYSFSLFNLI